MKVLSISLDKKILDNDSKNFQRQKEYAQLVDELYIVVFGPKKEIKSGNLFIYGSGGSNKICLFLRAYRTAKKILKNKDLKDWLVTSQDLFFSGLLGYLLKRKLGIKLHAQVHVDFLSPYFRKESFYNHLQYFLGKFIIKRTDGFRVVSQRIKNSLVRLEVDEDRITVVPIYTDVKPQTSNPKPQGREKFIFLTIGRLVPVKNIGLHIKAMTEIIKDYPDAELWIVGEGKEENKLKALTKKLELEDNVKFWGWQDDLEKFYKQADVFLLTSNYEGWGLVVIMAAGFSLPIIMTDVGCAGEVVENNKSGIVIPVGDKKALKKAMVELVGDKALREKLGKNAKKAVLELPSKEETLELYKKSWEMVLKK